jgi:hypothetical protein
MTKIPVTPEEETSGETMMPGPGAAFCEGVLIGTILSLFVWFWVVHG